MPTFQNVSPLGDVDIPGVGVIAAGAEFEVSDDLAPSLLQQPDNYRPAGSGAEVKAAFEQMTVEQLRALAAEREIDLAGATKKADIIAAVKKG